MQAVRLLAVFLALALAATFVRAADAPAQSPADRAQLVVHLLDYIGVDYGGAVDAGKVKSADEYKEMLEFTAQVQERIAALPRKDKTASIATEAAALARLVSSKAPHDAVAAQASRVRGQLISAYQLQVAPRKAPDLARGARLYADNCAACHGAEGRGNGPAARGLDPAPANFHDAERKASRSLYGFYNTITLGVEGTAMSPYRQLSEDDRWALAFYVGSLGVPPDRVQKGEALWRSATPALREAFRDYSELATLAPNDLKARRGADAALVQDYLRAHPEALALAKPDPIALARQKLAESAAAQSRGETANARELAVAAYLDGFELAESSLDNVDRDLRLEIEREMMGLRAGLANGVTAEAYQRDVRRADALLQRAGERIGEGNLSGAAAFTSSFIILLREGMEAILILSALIAFVVRTGRRDALPWLHAGWIAALALGAITWVAAMFLIDVSGANRELTEGVTSLIAAAMLLYVGYWLHGKAQSRNWTRFLREQVDTALEKKTLWAMASVSFLAVYRELFEVVLFYQALWAQAGEQGGSMVLLGIAAAGVILTVVGWALFKYSVRLPLGPFFTVMLWFVLLIAFVFAGEGVAKLQEAGAVSANPVHFFALPLLGIHPTLETLGAQVLVIATIAVSYWFMRERDSASKS